MLGGARAWGPKSTVRLDYVPPATQLNLAEAQQEARARLIDLAHARLVVTRRNPQIRALYQRLLALHKPKKLALRVYAQNADDPQRHGEAAVPLVCIPCRCRLTGRLSCLTTKSVANGLR